MKTSDQLKRIEERGSRLMFALVLIMLGISMLALCGAILSIN